MFIFGEDLGRVPLSGRNGISIEKGQESAGAQWIKDYLELPGSIQTIEPHNNPEEFYY